MTHVPDLTSTGPSTVDILRPMVVVLASPTPSEIGRLIPIEGMVSIGRSSDASVVFVDTALSKRHIEIVRTGQSCSVRDLQSRNGTLVNGTKIESSVLSAGDQIQIGATLLHFLDGSENRGDSWLKRALGSTGVALWEQAAETCELVFPDHIDAALDLPPATLGRKRLSPRDCVHRDDLERLAQGLVAAREGTPLEIEVRLQITPVLERWVMMRGTSTGARGSIAGTIVDITTLKRREATLSRMALVFESFFDGVALTDQDGMIVDLNAAMADMFALMRADTLGRRLVTTISIADPEGVAREVSQAVAATGTWRSTLQIGSDAYFDLLAFPLRTDRGEQAGLAWVFRDVTEKQRMAVQIAHLDRLVSLGTLSAGIAHEINNPLTFILGNAEHLRELIADGKEPPAEVVDDIVDGAERIATIVRDLKVFARAEVSATPRGFEPRAAIELAVKLAGSTTRSLATIVTSIESTRLVKAVESRLVQILVNLLINAAQSMPGNRTDGTITIRSWDQGDGVGISVADTGIGMSPEVVARVFDPFFTTKAHVGTGLGLSVCYGLISGMGGQIALSSIENEGTTASLWLPAANSEAAWKPAPHPTSQPQSRLRILVIDDEPLVRSCTMRLLAGHDVTAVDGYRAAVERLVVRRESYDVILCDLTMPDGTGMDLHARLVHERPEIVPCVIYVTGETSSSLSAEFLSGVSNRHLLKPVSREILREAVSNLRS